MFLRNKIRLLTAGLVLWTCLPPGLSQEAVQAYNTTADITSSLAERARQQNYNIALGEFYLNIDGQVSLSYTDNVNLGTNGKQSDFSIGPTINFTGSWNATERNRFLLGLGIGYVYHTSSDNLNTILITPNSITSFSFDVGEVTVTLHDSISLTQDPVDEPTVSNAASFQSLRNTIGVGLQWNPGTWRNSLSYSHQDTFFQDAAFENLSGRSDNIVARSGSTIGEASEAGAEFSTSLNRSNQGFLNDSNQKSIGLYFDHVLSRFISVGIQGGLTLNSADNNGTIGDTDASNSYYLGLRLNHRVNDKLRHSLSVNKGSQGGTRSNFVDLWTINENVSYQLTERLNLSIPITYQTGTESGLAGEKFSLWSIGLGTGFRLSEKITMSANYNHNSRTSDQALRDYRQNRITLSFRYDF